MDNLWDEYYKIKLLLKQINTSYNMNKSLNNIRCKYPNLKRQHNTQVPIKYIKNIII